MIRRQEVALVLRERRAAVEQTLLNRAMRHDKGLLDRVVTRLVAATLPDTAAVAPRDAGILDRPGRERRDVVSSDAIADEIVDRDEQPATGH